MPEGLAVRHHLSSQSCEGAERADELYQQQVAYLAGAEDLKNRGRQKSGSTEAIISRMAALQRSKTASFDSEAALRGSLQVIFQYLILHAAIC